MKNQTKKIQDLLKLYDYNLHNTPMVSRQTILLQMTEDLEDNKGEFRKYLQQRGGKLSYLNSFLAQHNLPALRKLKSSFPLFKIIFSVLAAGFLIIALSFYFLIDSYLPLYEYNEIDNTVSLLGGEALMEPDSSSYFSKRAHAYGLLNIKDEEFLYNFNAKIAATEFDNISIRGKNIDLFLLAYHADFFVVDCRSSVSETFNDMKVNAEKTLLVDFKGTQQCDVKIPQNVFLKIEAENAAIFSKKISNNFEMNFKNAYITLKKEDMKFYQSLDSVTKSKFDLSPNGKYQGKITSETGETFIR